MGQGYKVDVLKEFIKSLSKKYHVSVSHLGDDAGFHDSTFRYWLRGRNIPRETSLDIFEDFLKRKYPNEVEQFKEIRKQLRKDASVLAPAIAQEKESAKKMDVILNNFEEITGFTIKTYKTQFKGFYVDVIIREEGDICEIWLYHEACTAKDMLCAVHISDVLRGYSSLSQWLDSQLYSIVDSFIECYKTENKAELENE